MRFGGRSSRWTWCVLALSVLFIAWSVRLTFQVGQLQSQVQSNVRLINRLNQFRDSIRRLEAVPGIGGAADESNATAEAWPDRLEACRSGLEAVAGGLALSPSVRDRLTVAGSHVERMARLPEPAVDSSDQAAFAGREAEIREAVRAGVVEIEAAVEDVRGTMAGISRALWGRWDQLHVIVIVSSVLASLVVWLLLLNRRKLTLLHRAEAELERRETLYRNLVETSHDLIWSVDAEGRWSFVNQASRLIYGREPHELIGRPFLESLAPERVASERERLERGKAGEAHFQYETKHARKDGSQVTLHFHAIVVRDDLGRVVGTTGTATDVTERRRAEDALAQSEAIYRRAIESASGVPYRRNFRAERYEFLGAGIEPLTGLTAEAFTIEAFRQQVLERRVLDPVMGSDPANYFLAVKNGTLDQYRMDLHIRTARGEEKWVSDCAVPLRDERSGEIVGSLGILQDITDRKLAEASLRESEERFRVMFEQAAVGIAQIAPDGRFLRVNKRLCEILGRPADELMRQTFAEITDPEDLAADLEFRRKALAGEVATFTLEKRYLRSEGGVVWASLTASLVRDEEQRPLYFIAVLEDITQRRLAEEELARHRSGLEDLVNVRTRELEASQERLAQTERLASVGTLAAGVAHEINNPVGAILLAARNALTLRNEDGRGSDDILDRCLDDISRNARRCGDIVKSVLQFARQEPTEKWPCDLNAVVEYAVEATRGYALQKGVRLELDRAPAPLELALNPIAIEQVLINLLRNAVEAGDRGSRVAARVETTPAGARVVVEDDGCGMGDDERRRALDPFFTTRRHSGGTGLGLSIAHGIIVEHGGVLEISSRPGRGTSIVVELPRAIQPG